MLNCIEDALAWAAGGAGGRAALQLDSGLTRAGFDARALLELLAHPALVGRLNLCLLLTHFASADDPNAAQNERQRQQFATLRASFPNLPSSCANSDALMLGPGFRGDVVRPGIALYGGRPFASGPNPMQPVVRLQARVLQRRLLQAPADVGYGGSVRVSAGTRLVIAGIGYADGYPRSLGNGAGQARFAGASLPVLGRVSMDLTTFDATALGENAPTVGDYLTLYRRRCHARGRGLCGWYDRL